jgi:hypothetical protein
VTLQSLPEFHSIKISKFLSNIKANITCITIIKRKTKWIGHILVVNCLLKHVMEGKIDVKRRRGRRCKQLLDDLEERSGYWKLKGEALDGSVWRIRFGRGCGPAARQTTALINVHTRMHTYRKTSTQKTVPIKMLFSGIISC